MTATNSNKQETECKHKRKGTDMLASCSVLCLTLDLLCVTSEADPEDLSVSASLRHGPRSCRKSPPECTHTHTHIHTTYCTACINSE